MMNLEIFELILLFISIAMISGSLIYIFFTIEKEFHLNSLLKKWFWKTYDKCKDFVLQLKHSKQSRGKLNE